MSPARPSLTLVAVASAVLAMAAAYEGPRTFQASEILKPSQVKGLHFQVAAQVPTEGYLHLFSITTEDGVTEVSVRAKKELGAARLEMRLTGRMWPVAQKEMAARGWAVVENVPSSMEVLQAKAAAAASKK